MPVMKTASRFLFLPLSLGLTASLSAATISWQAATTIDDPTDISNSAGTLHVAADFNTALNFGPDDATINGIPFQAIGAGNDVPGLLTTDIASGPGYSTTYFTGATGDADLDALLDSHSWFGGNPATATITLEGLTNGLDYQVQLIGAADARSCCAARTYEPDDGAGNFTTGVSVQRGLFQTTIGTFTADGATQQILWRSLNNATGNNDPGLSGLVVIQVPEPASALLLLLGAAPLALRRRR